MQEKEDSRFTLEVAARGFESATEKGCLKGFSSELVGNAS